MPTLTAERKVRTRRATPPSSSAFNYDNDATRVPNAELREAMEDVRLWRNITCPFDTVEELMRDMLEVDV